MTKDRYRPDGLRLCKEKADGTETGHIWDGSEMVAEYQANGTVIARYLRGINLIARELDGQQEYYLHNAHGDVVQRTDRYGTPLKSYDYDAFGNEEKPEELDHNPWRYCGEYLDLKVQNYYLRARYYEPRTGRFTQQDSVAYTTTKLPNGAEAVDPLSLNLYTYCIGNPVRYFNLGGNMAALVDSLFNENFMKSLRLINKTLLRKSYNSFSNNLPMPVVSSAGPIYNQASPSVTDIRMGFGTANDNGCGWISAYNAMYLLGNTQSPNSIIHYLENDGGLVMNGLLGTNPESIANYFTDMGINANLSYDMLLGVDRSVQTLETNVFVLLYSHGSGAHYIAVQYKGGKYYAYNVYSDSKNAEEIDSIDSWLTRNRYIPSALIRLNKKQDKKGK